MKITILLTLLSSIFLLPLGHAAGFGSSYATIAKEHCTTQPRRAGEQSTIRTCPDFKGIGISVVTDNVQQHLVLSSDNRRFPLIFKENTTKNSVRTTLGTTIEWRLKRNRTDSVIGMIMRLYVHTANKRKRSFLIVSKVTADNICIVGSVPPQRNQNQKARNIVDRSANMPCLSATLSKEQILNKLVGSWIEPVPGRSREFQGFTLYANGNAESINMQTLRYQKWRVEGNSIIFTVKNIVNSWSSSENERYTFAFCEQKLCLTAGNITQAYAKQRSVANINPNTNNSDNSPSSQRLTIGMMIGRQYADHCSFLKPLDLRNFVYKDDNSWRFLFSSNPKKRSARIGVNNRIERLELVNVSENFYTKTMTERYRVVGTRDFFVTLKKTEVNNFNSYKRYKGTVVVERDGATNQVEVLGDCRL